MALPLKTAGLAELTAFRRRLKRQWAREAISREDFEFIESHLNAIEARVVRMREEGEDNGN